jgi:hypothetical protein
MRKYAHSLWLTANSATLSITAKDALPLTISTQPFPRVRVAESPTATHAPKWPLQFHARIAQLGTLCELIIWHV